MTEMTAFDAVSHAFGALGEYKEDEEIHAFLDALPQGWYLGDYDDHWLDHFRREGAQQERERLREEAKTLFAESAGAGWHVQAWLDEDVLPALDRLLADPEDDR
jgi:hypothetical protein